MQNSRLFGGSLEASYRRITKTSYNQRQIKGRSGGGGGRRWWGL